MAEIARAVRAAARAHTEELLRYPNVVGVGAARKMRKGRPVDEHAVVVYVLRKVPAKMLDQRHRIPPRLDIDDETVSSDVVEVAQPRLLDVDTKQYRPLQGGCQIQTVSGSGTLGAILYDRNDHQPVLLTCNHVLTNAGAPTTLPANVNVFQPAGGPLVGLSKRIVPMFMPPLGVFDYNFEAGVDAGIIAPQPGIGVDFSVAELGTHPYVVLPPSEGLEVHHRGFRTQLRTGTVEAVDLTIISKASNGSLYRIGGGGNVFSIRAPERLIGAWPGDSGSLVVDANHGSSRGIVFSGDGQTHGLTYACELGEIMSELQLETACSGALHALVGRAVFRRMAVAWAAAEGHAIAGTPHHSNALVQAMTDKANRFREVYLRGAGDGRLAGIIDATMHHMAPHLAETLYRDEEFAGLLDRVIGDWLVLPTLFDMLEYRIPEDVGPAAIKALERVQGRARVEQALGGVEVALARCAGLTVREWVNLDGVREASAKALSSQRAKGGGKGTTKRKSKR